MDDILLNPNLIYLFLIGGFSLVFMAILTPGTGILEIAGLFSLIIAGWGVYHLGLNYWALVLLIVGVFPFVIMVRRTGRNLYLWISVLSLVVGTAFLLKGATWYQMVVEPGLVIAVSVTVGGLFWVITQKTLEADAQPPTHDLSVLIGAVGEAKSTIHHDGSVQVHKELWTARSETPIEAGAKIRVIGREGFVLVVEEA